jgi:hypothetical protein
VLNSCLPVKLTVKLVQSNAFLQIILPANNILNFEYVRVFIPKDIKPLPHVYSDATLKAMLSAHIHHASSSVFYLSEYWWGLVYPVTFSNYGRFQHFICKTFQLINDFNMSITTEIFIPYKYRKCHKYKLRITKIVLWKWTLKCMDRRDSFLRLVASSPADMISGSSTGNLCSLTVGNADTLKCAACQR